MLLSKRSVPERKTRIAGLLAMAVCLRLAAQSPQTVYDDSLQNGWQNWSWATVSLTNSSPVHGGSSSISVSSAGWEALYLHHAAQNSSQWTNLTFWINGGSTGGQVIQVQGARNMVAQTNHITVLPPLAANTWVKMVVPLSQIDISNVTDFDGFWLQVQGTAPTFYVDDIAMGDPTNSPPGTNTQLSIVINVSSNRHAISPLIYGVAFATPSQLSDLNSPLNRSGGNAETRNNWFLNAHNRGSDWYFESLPDDGTSDASPPGASVDQFVTDSKNGGAQPLLTIPMIGWLPKSRARLSGYSIAKYGPQTGNDSQWFADAGNGVGVQGTNTWQITTNNPNDAALLTNSAFQQALVQHLTNRWGLSTNGGVRYYLMDNEHALWNSTHRDVHPVGTTMQEIRDKMLDYAGVVKAIDPSALVLGPEEWGWPAYLYSGYDWTWAGANGNYNPAAFPDRAANGGWDYFPWLLDQFKQRATNGNPRLLDYLTAHIYPQGDNQGHNESGNDVSTATQLLRNRSTRQLWDPNYFDPSWIQNYIKLIPRLKSWVATYYPGTKTGITEYNWGAEGYINGATAQADIFGIMGREGLDLATRWTTPPTGSPTYNAMKMYRNYDGSKSCFGDTSVSAAVPNPDNVASFAAVRSTDGALTVMVINKQLSATNAMVLNFTNFLPANTAQVWRLTSANVITRLSDLAFTGNTLSNTLPAQSITLFVLPAGGAPRLRAGAVASGTFDLWLDGVAGQRYRLLATTDFANWTPLQTNLLASSSIHLNFPGTGQYRFFRAEWVP